MTRKIGDKKLSIPTSGFDWIEFTMKDGSIHKIHWDDIKSIHLKVKGEVEDYVT